MEVAAPWVELFMNGRTKGTRKRWTLAGSSAPKAVLTTPACSALTVTEVPLELLGELVREEQVGEFGLVVGPRSGVGPLPLQVVEVHSAHRVRARGHGDHPVGSPAQAGGERPAEGVTRAGRVHSAGLIRGHNVVIPPGAARPHRHQDIAGDVPALAHQRLFVLVDNKQVGQLEDVPP
jgi:hypothetical protein